MRRSTRQSGTSISGKRLAALTVAGLAVLGTVADVASARVPGPAAGRAAASSALATACPVPLVSARQLTVCTAALSASARKPRRRVSIAGRPVLNLSPYATVGIGGHSV